MCILAFSLFSKILVASAIGISILIVFIKVTKEYRIWPMAQCYFCLVLGRNYKCTCGHKAKAKTLLTLDNKKRGIYTLGKKREYCPQCWAKAAIKCAWCGKTIAPGDAITLYTPHESFPIPHHAVFYKQTPHPQLVGCLRTNCADSGADRAGFWVMPGVVLRVASPIEMLMANMKKGDCNLVVVHDLSNLNEAFQITDENINHPDEVARPKEAKS